MSESEKYCTYQINRRPQFLETHDKNNKTPLILALQNDDVAMVTFLFNLGANVNTATMYTKRTPLMLALFNGKLDVARILCDKGADPNLKDINGLNILHHAVDSNFLSSVEFALKFVSDIDVKDCNGWTPLMRGSM